MESTVSFYQDLVSHKLSLPVLLKDEKYLHPVPSDWHVIITDIKGSTGAVAAGLHETVNLIATGSIVTVLNLAHKAGITIPFFFGGDGATFIVPGVLLDIAMKGLLRFKTNTLANFNLQLRVGTVSVQQIYQQGKDLNISKYSVSSFFSIPVVLGTGLSYAEQLVKGDDYLLSPDLLPAEELDLTGMQCRWDKIDPPENNQEIVTLLIIAKEGRRSSLVFSKVIDQLEEIYGSLQKRQPISVNKLRLKSTFARLKMEMRARIGSTKLFELIQNWLINGYGYIYFRTEKGKNYLNRLVEMSDTLVIDGRINTVISGNETQRLLLENALDLMEKSGDILYGIHLSRNSVMSCYVRDLENDHIHFVDGSEGGYTQAARQLKGKIAKNCC
ncbi:DUF3095 domain-containing protein [Pedobacter sp. PLR]|uniref:DUF3095 domain-containing protein n=1 Tax=Pedobacter sp. PLR TaxID=2994465 RepID=UPI00224726E3|nr:DUF3095 domain-containing protein [Pedobacter sp. PLR]MCX2451616.1 DUF3095 domain-containing protein [Pedobacter sp. PLR]